MPDLAMPEMTTPVRGTALVPETRLFPIMR